MSLLSLFGFRNSPTCHKSIGNSLQKLQDEKFKSDDVTDENLYGNTFDEACVLEDKLLDTRSILMCQDATAICQDLDYVHDLTQDGSNLKFMELKSIAIQTNPADFNLDVRHEAMDFVFNLKSKSELVKHATTQTDMESQLFEIQQELIMIHELVNMHNYLSYCLVKTENNLSLFSDWQQKFLNKINSIIASSNINSKLSVFVKATLSAILANSIVNLLDLPELVNSEIFDNFGISGANALAGLSIGIFSIITLSILQLKLINYFKFRANVILLRDKYKLQLTNVAQGLLGTLKRLKY